MSNLIKNLLVALGVAVVLFVLYITFFQSDPEEGLLVSTSAQSDEVSIQTQNLLAQLNELENYKMEGEFLTDPLFVSLKSIQTDLGTEPTGRRNPFFPVR